MNEKITLVVLTKTSLLSQNVFANDLNGKFYFGANYEIIGYDESGLSGSYSVTALAFKGEYFNFAVEGKFGFGVGSGSDTETVSNTNVNVEVSLDSYFSFLAVGYLPVNQKLNLYGKAGFSSVSISGTASAGGTGLSVSDSGSSLSFYFGGEYKVQPDLALNIELGSLYNRNNVSMGSFNLGVTKYF